MLWLKFAVWCDFCFICVIFIKTNYYDIKLPKQKDKDKTTNQKQIWSASATIIGYKQNKHKKYVGASSSIYFIRFQCRSQWKQKLCFNKQLQTTSRTNFLIVKWNLNFSTQILDCVKRVSLRFAARWQRFLLLGSAKATFAQQKRKKKAKNASNARKN